MHERYRQTDRQTTDRQTDGRAFGYSEREREFTFAKNDGVVMVWYTTVWSLYTNVTDITDRTGQTNRQLSDSIGRTVLQTVAQKRSSTVIAYSRLAPLRYPRITSTDGTAGWRLLQGSVHTTRAYGPCRRVVFTDSVDREHGPRTRVVRLNPIVYLLPASWTTFPAAFRKTRE